MPRRATPGVNLGKDVGKEVTARLVATLPGGPQAVIRAYEGLDLRVTARCRALSAVPPTPAATAGPPSG